MNDYQQGMIDGLELAFTVCDKTDSLDNAKQSILYFIRLAKDDKFSKIKMQLGAVG